MGGATNVSFQSVVPSRRGGFTKQQYFTCHTGPSISVKPSILARGNMSSSSIFSLPLLCCAFQSCNWLMVIDCLFLESYRFSR